ncbi:MAG: zinc ribbon domain-containing protein, partial [Chloroflexales bacterium]
ACVTLGYVGIVLFTTIYVGRLSLNRVSVPLLVAGLATVSPAAEMASGVLIYDDFSSPRRSTLTGEEDETSRSAFEDGAYVIEVKESDTLAWALTNGDYRDMAVETDSVVASGSAAVAAGLIFHYQDSRNFYLFSVSSDGYYALEVLKDDTWQTLIDWTQSDAIKPAHNTLRVETKGSRITLKANGELLEVTQDDTLAGGDAGLAVSSFETGKVTIRFDNLLITRNP